MSPALKEAVPIGTLATHVLQSKPPPTALRKQLNLASQGWRSNSFKSASEKLSKASTKLQAEAEKESRYWAQIADLTARGWPVSRLPRDAKAIGVHFGFPEAAQQFRDRGFALLRQSEDGTVSLDNPRRRKRLGVAVTRNNKTTGVFHFRTTQKDQTANIDQQITEARDSLFEEELFYEISREARSIANQGITTRGQHIEIALDAHSKLSLLFGEEHENDESTSSEDKETAEFVGTSLRLLLNAMHEQNLARRSQRPPVMTLKPRPVPEYALIRPLLAHLRHRTQLTALWTYCDAQTQPFTKAGLPVAIRAEESSAGVFKSLKIESSATTLAELMLPAKTALEVTLAGERRLQVGLATFLGAPLFGSRFETSKVDFDFASVPSSHHETFEAFTSFIRHVLLLDLVAHIASLAAKAPSKSQNTDRRESKHWKVSSPHSGELTLWDSGEAVKKIQAAVHSHSISIKLTTKPMEDAPKHLMWSWTLQGYSKADSKGVARDPGRKFDEVVNEILRSA
jgi:mediator of RNA polymerase II transcription subunit 17